MTPRFFLKTPPQWLCIGLRKALAACMWLISMAHLQASQKIKLPLKQLCEQSATIFLFSSAAVFEISIPLKKYSMAGVSYVIIGTAAVKNPGFLRDACGAFGGSIIVGLDAKDGKVATDGWSKLTGHDVIDLAKKFEDYGIDGIIYTDIGRDGMLSGVNIEATVRLAQAVGVPIFASGGIGGISDIEKLCAVEDEGIEGAILGRSIYEGSIDFAKAQDLADELNG
jgi:phosphoribosylformimino-5-aminoimidazole carboxamide ribotide isomerase